jgi:hypothetical protein
MLLLYILLNIAALLLCFYAKKQLDDFLGAHPSIGSQRDISDLKRLARAQMHMALLQLALLGTALIVGLVLIWSGGVKMLLLVLLANGVVFIAARLVKPTEARVQSLQCATPELAEAQRRIVTTWKNKPLPDF